MKKNMPYLSPTEYSFMKILWNAERPLAVSEILERREEGTWAKNSVHPLINSLLKKGFLSVEGFLKVSKVNSRLFLAKISLAEYSAAQIKGVFEGSSSKFQYGAFLSSFLGDDEICDQETINELEIRLKEYREGKKTK